MDLRRQARIVRGDYVYYYDYYRVYGAAAAAKPGPQGAAASCPLANKRG